MSFWGYFRKNLEMNFAGCFRKNPEMSFAGYFRNTPQFCEKDHEEVWRPITPAGNTGRRNK